MGKALFSKKQSDFLMAGGKRTNLLTGSVRSGKTHISLIKFALFVGETPKHYEFLMCGKTMTSLARNCLVLLERLVGATNFSYSTAQKKATLFGRRVWLEGANDGRSESKIRGLTLGGAYCDELTLVPKEFYIMLLSRMSLTGAKLYATTNPDSPNHWVKKDILDNGEIQGQLAHWHFTLDDNEYNDPEYVENLKREYTGVFYDRFVLGKWALAEGLIYSLFSNNQGRYLIADPASYIKERKLRLTAVFVGVDWGHNKSANTAVAVGVTAGGGEVIVLDEYYTQDELDPESLNTRITAFLRSVTAQYGACRVYADNAEGMLVRGLANAAQRSGIRAEVRNCVKHKITDRIVLTNALLATDRLKVTRKCRYFIDAMTNAVWDSKAVKDERLDDGTFNVDSLDAFEYALCSVMGRLGVRNSAGKDREDTWINR